MIEERQKQCHKERRRLTKIALNHARSAQKMCSKTFGCDYRQSKCSSPSWFRVSVTFQNHMQLSRHQRLTKMEHWHGREQMKNTTASIQFPLSEAALPANPRMILKMKVKSLSRVQLFATPWTTSLLHLWGFSRQEYWSGLPFPSPEDLFQPRDRTWVSQIVGRRFTVWASREW